MKCFQFIAQCFILCSFVFIVSGPPAFSHTLHVTDDTESNLNKPNENNGKARNLLIKNVGSGGDRHGYFKFDLSSLGASVVGEDVKKATLRIYVHNVDNEGDVSVHRVLDAWQEETFTSGAGVMIDPVLESSTTVTKSEEKGIVTFEVTQVVRDWLDGSLGNHGLALLPSTGGDGDVKMTLSSKEKLDLTLPAEIEVALVDQVGEGIESLTAGDSSMTIGGTPLAPTVAVALEGITSPRIADGTILDADISAGANIGSSKINNATFVERTGDTMVGPLVLPTNGLTVGTSQVVTTAGGVGIGSMSPGNNRLRVTTGNINDYAARFENTDQGGNVFVKLASSSHFGVAASFMNGLVGIRTENPCCSLHVVGTVFATDGVASSKRLKENIAKLSTQQAFKALGQLDPVTFQYRFDDREDLQIGFIAEDVPELVSTPDRKGIHPMDIIAVLTKVVQDQQKQIEDLTSLVTQQNEVIQARLHHLESQARVIPVTSH